MQIKGLMQYTGHGKQWIQSEWILVSAMFVDPRNETFIDQNSLYSRLQKFCNKQAEQWKTWFIVLEQGMLRRKDNQIHMW